MTRLYLKLLGSVLLMLALFYAVSNYYMSQIGSQVAQGNLRERFRPIFSLTEDMLAPLPRAQWNAAFDDARKRFGYDAKLIDVATLIADHKLSSAVQHLLNEGNILIFSHDTQMLAAKRIANSDVALLLYLPGLNNSRYYTDAGYFTLWLLLFAILIGLWLIPYRRDLAHMNQVAERIGGGNFEARASLRKGSALFALSESFNSMAARVGQLVRAHKELTNAVSHELRNPLMRLRFRHQLAREVEAAADKNRNLDSMSEDLDELDLLADELLTYAKLERLEPDIRLEPVDMAHLLGHAVDSARQLVLAQGKHVAIETQIGIERANGEPHYLERAVGNLLSNAIRHAKQIVRVSIRRIDSHTELSIDDDGPGIPEAERARLFEPFARTDQARARNSGGFGMGLAIARRIARWHGGDIRVEQSSLGGARFVMCW